MSSVMSNKILKRIILVFAVVFVLFSLTSVIAFAAPAPVTTEVETFPYDEDFKAETDISNSIAQKAYELAEFVYKGGAFDRLDEALQISVEDSPGGAETPVWKAASGVYDYAKLIGGGLVVLYCLIDLLGKVQLENFSLEQFFKMMIKLFVGLWFINQGLDIVKNIAIFGNSISSGVGNLFTAQDEGMNAGERVIMGYYQHECANCDGNLILATAKGMGIFLGLLIPYLGMYAARALAYIITYSRAIEFFVRASFAPIGLANLWESGVNSGGFRYLKKLIAVALQGGVILVIIRIYSFVVQNVIQVDGGSAMLMFQELIITFAVVSIMLKSQSWANDLLGV